MLMVEKQTRRKKDRRGEKEKFLLSSFNRADSPSPSLSSTAASFIYRSAAAAVISASPPHSFSALHLNLFSFPTHSLILYTFSLRLSIFILLLLFSHDLLATYIFVFLFFPPLCIHYSL